MESTQVIKKETTSAIQQAQDIAISTQVQYEGASDFVKLVKGLQKKIKETFDPIVNAANKAHKEATQKRKEFLDPALAAEKIAKGKMVVYVEEQERIRREQEEKLRKKAEAEEARRKEVLEEQARRQEKKAEELRRQAEEVDAKEREKLEEQARKAEEEAEKRREKKEDVHIEAPILAPRVDKVKGIHYVEKWFAKVVDFAKLPDPYKLSNMPMLNKTAQTQKGTIPIPGVVFEKEKIVASRNSF